MRSTQLKQPEKTCHAGDGVQQAGFSLVELIVTIVLMSILAFAVLGRWSNQTVNLSAQAEQLAGDIRYTQSLAMTGGQRYRIDINAGAGSYQIVTEAGGPVIHPATNTTAPIALPAGVTISATTNAQIIFDGRGRPYSAPLTLLAADAVITLAGVAETRAVRVNPNTGRVIVQ